MSHIPCETTPRRTRRRAAWVAAGAVLVAAPAIDAQDNVSSPPWVSTFTVDAGFADYAGGGSASQSMGLYLSQPDRYWRFAVGHHWLFESEAYSAGFYHQHTWSRKYRLGGGLSSGVNRSGGLAPRYHVSVMAGMNVVPRLPLSVSFSRRRSAINESHVDRVDVGFTWYAPGPWIIGASTAYSLGQPGSTSSRSYGGGITYSVWERVSLGVRIDHGDGSYMLLPSQNIVEFRSWSYTAHLSRHLNPRTSVRVSAGYSEYYDGPNFNLGYSRRW
jgi:YaiO family outer membrane protein